MRTYPAELTVITISTNQRALTEACLRSVFAQQASLRFEVIVVDNASSDGTAQMVRDSFPQVCLVNNPVRLGYAANNNLGIRLAHGRYPMILNPDVEVLPGAFEALIHYMDGNPSVGLAGPKLLNSDRTLQYSCRRFSTPGHLLIRGLHLDRFNVGAQVLREAVYMDQDHTRVLDVDYITGACMVTRREMLAGVGLLDEGFTLYFEDQDWCRRAWQKGWRVTYMPEAQMIHHHQRASARGLFSKSTRIHVRSMVRYFRKHSLPFPFRIHPVEETIPISGLFSSELARAQGGNQP